MGDYFGSDQVNLREMQAFHDVLDRDKGFDRDMLRNVAYLAEEVGEVVSAICEIKDAASLSAEQAGRAHLGEELADCLAYLLKLANYGGLDLQAAYIQKMNHNFNRTWPRQENQERV